MFAAPESIIREVAKADKSASSDSSDDDDLCNLAAKIVTLNGAKASTSSAVK